MWTWVRESVEELRESHEQDMQDFRKEFTRESQGVGGLIISYGSPPTSWVKTFGVVLAGGIAGAAMGVLGFLVVEFTGIPWEAIFEGASRFYRFLVATLGARA